MTSKNWFFKGMTEEIKRRLWAAALSAVIFFFSFPVVMVYLTTVAYVDTDINRKMRLASDALNILSYRNGWTGFLMAVLAVVLGISGFSYLNSRRKVDFYHSLPVRREKLFAVQYTTGILIAAVPYLVFVLTAAAIASAYGVSSADAFSTALKGWGFEMLSFLVLYTTAVIAVMMTGNTVVALLGFGVFNGLFPLFLGMWSGLAENCLDTFCNYDLMAGWVPRTSPLAFYISGFSEDMAAGKVISRLAVSAILLLIAVVLHKKRPSEAAGKAMAFSISQPVIGVLLVTEFSVAGLIFFWSLGSGSLGWALFGLLAGGVLSHCVIEIIYHFDFKKLFCCKGQLALSLILGFGFFALFRWDLTGYDRWIPAEDKVQSAAVYCNNLDGWVDYGYFGAAGEEYEGGHWNWQSVQDRVFADMSLADAGLACEVAERWQSLPQPEEDDYSWDYVYVKFQMNSGRQVLRRYRFPQGTLEEAFQMIYEDPGYKAGRYPVLFMDPGEVEEIQLSVKGERQFLKKQAAVSGEQLGALLEAYQADLRELTLEESGEAPLAEIRFLDGQRLKAVEIGQMRYNSDVEYYPIYPACSRTVSWLAAAGIPVDQKVDPDSIRSVQVEVEVEELVSSETVLGADTYEEQVLVSSYKTYMETDREVIRRLAKRMIYAPYREYQNLSEWDGYTYLDVNFYAGSAEEALSRGNGDYTRTDQGEIYYTLRFYIPDSPLSEELRERALEHEEPSMG